MKKRSVKQILCWVMVLVFIFSVFMPTGLVFADTVSGNIYYLATNGSDSNPGTKDAPFASITYAFAKLASGDTLLIRGGTYKGFLQIIDKQNVTIKNYDGEKVVIQDGSIHVGYLAYIGGGTEADGTPKTRNAVISGISFSFANGETGAGMYIDLSNNVKVTNCEFSLAQGGIVVRSGADSFDISCNIMHECIWAYGGILLYNATNGKVYNNVVYNSYFGVLFYGSASTNNQIYNNTFYNNTLDIGVSNLSGIAHDNIFRNNIFSSVIQNQNHDNPDATVDNFMSLNSFDYNCYNSVIMSDGVVTNDGLTLQQLKAMSVPIETNGFIGDPKFVNAATSEFQIGRGSACIGKGTAALATTLDILGQPQTNPPDIGAYLHAERVNYYVATSGDDTNAGTDAAPFKTIAHAVSVMQSGDYLFIKGGTYAEGIIITGKTNIVVKNYQADQPVITQSVNIQDSQNVTVEGFDINNSVVIGNGKDIKVTNMDVNGGQIVVVPGSGTSTDGYEISSCVISGFQGEGAILVYNGKNGNISNNVILNNKNQGILLEGGECINNSLYNNTLYGNGSDLLLVYAPSLGNPSNNTFKNNIFSNGLVMGNDKFYTTNVFDYNFYNKSVMTDGIGAGYANVYDEAGNFIETVWPALADLQAKGVELNGFLGDPSFINPGINDLRLRKTSDCIGRGTSAGAPLYDIKGLMRSEPFDMGAYKFTGEVSDYYVDVAKGDDINPGTQEAPFKTIQHAVDLLASGETVYIKGGTYNEGISISNKKGSATDNYSIKNVAGETVVLSSDNQKETAVSIDQGSGFWKIEGLNIQNYINNGIEIKGGSSNIELGDINISNVGENGIYGETSSNSTLENIKITNAKYGMALSASTGWSVDKSYIDKASEAAASFNGSSNNKVTASVLTNSKIGMDLNGSNNLVIYNNDFNGNSRSDIKFDQASTGSVVKNNIFGSANSMYALEIADINNDLDYNCYNKASNAVAVSYTSTLTLDQFKALGKETNGILADPMFTDPASGNFLLKPYSPCAGKGIKDSNSPVMGYDGANFGFPMDIGAYFSPFSMKTYYVATTGDDSNDGSLEHPWGTIKKGMSSIKQSDTLYIRGGVYNERIDLYDMDGRSFAYFTVKNYNGEKVLLDSQFSQDVGIKFNNCSYWKVEGLNFTNYTGAAIWVTSGSENIVMENLEIWNIDNPEFVQSGTEGILGDGGNSTVRNCYIHDIGQTRRSQSDHGIYIGYGAHGWVFDSNKIDNAPGGGIQMYGKPGGGDDITVTNNVITNCKYGLIMTMGKRNTISNNTFYNNWEYDLYMDWWYNDSTIQNNIFYNDLPAGMTVKVEDRANLTTKDYQINPVPFAFLYEEVSNNVFRNNMVYNKNFGSRVVDGKTIKPLQDYLGTQQLNTITNLMEADPLFVNAASGDFKLQDNSPCIDAGVVDKAPTVDITGATRVFEPDLGAYENTNISIPYLQRLINRYVKSGDLSGPIVKDLTDSLNQAQKELDKGRIDKAVKNLEKLKKDLNKNEKHNVITAVAKSTLNDSVDALIKMLQKK